MSQNKSSDPAKRCAYMSLIFATAVPILFILGPTLLFLMLYVVSGGDKHVPDNMDGFSLRILLICLPFLAGAGLTHLSGQTGVFRMTFMW